MHKSTSVILMLLLFSTVVGDFVPKTNAQISGTKFYEEVIGLPFHSREVDVDSNGNIFLLSYDQDVWRSTDNGFSWTKVFDDSKDWTAYSPVTTRNWLTLFIDSRDYIFVNILSESKGWNLYRSIDGGNTWSISLVTKRSWHMDEASNGTLYTHDYSPDWSAIYKSNDGGATWSVFWNFTMYGEDLRTMAVNDYNDNEVWAATNKRVMYWNGSSWITVHYDSRGQSYISSIWFDPKYVYLGAEYLGGRKANWRYPHAPTPVPLWDYDYYWDADKLNFVPDEHSFRGLRINDIMLFGIRSQLWGSWDGNRWVKIADLGNSTASDIESVSQRRPIYFVDKKVGKLYRLSITKEDLIQLYYGEFLKYRGNLTNQENYVTEYRIVNGTNQVDLTGEALNNVQASIKGLSRINYFNNSGFETGTLPPLGWTISGDGVLSDSNEAYEGMHSLKIMKSASDAWDKALWQSFIPAPRGTILTLSAWAKANMTLTNKVFMGFRNQTSETWANYPGSASGAGYFNVTTSWTRIKLYFAVNAPDVNLRAEFYALKGATYELLVDGLQLEKREVEIIRQEPDLNTESIEQLQYQPSPYFADTLDTINPSLSIAGQDVSYSRTLKNGTESPKTTLSGIFTGAVTVDTNIKGSGQAILRLTGTRILWTTNSVLRERTNDGIYVGRYYSTPTIATNTTDLIALTDKEANITNPAYGSYKLSLTLNALPGTTSTTLIYVGDKGKPKAISGTTDWNFDESSKILTLNVIPIQATATITIRWPILGDINNDGTVDIFDAAIVNAHWYPGPPIGQLDYNPIADINKDGAVNILDMAIINTNWGLSV